MNHCCFRRIRCAWRSFLCRGSAGSVVEIQGRQGGGLSPKALPAIDVSFRRGSMKDFARFPRPHCLYSPQDSLVLPGLGVLALATLQPKCRRGLSAERLLHFFPLGASGKTAASGFLLGGRISP